MYTLINPSQQLNFPYNQVPAYEDRTVQDWCSSPFIQRVIEGFVDGILILTFQGRLLYANSQAQQFCQQWMPIAPTTVPDPIWQLCIALTTEQRLGAQQPEMIESEITTQSTVIRVRVRSLILAEWEQPYLLVTLEDRCQAIRNLAIFEAQKYGLTRRETEVWLLRRANRSYQQIAAELYITLETVRKHLKSIYTKREEFQWSSQKTSQELR